MEGNQNQLNNNNNSTDNSNTQQNNTITSDDIGSGYPEIVTPINILLDRLISIRQMDNNDMSSDPPPNNPMQYDPNNPLFHNINSGIPNNLVKTLSCREKLSRIKNNS